MPSNAIPGDGPPPESCRASEDELAARLARHFESEAAAIASSLPAAIVLAAAAVLTHGDPGLAALLPQVAGRDALVLPTAHLGRFTAPLEQLLRLAGGRVRQVGTVVDCDIGELRHAMLDAAAGIYVVHGHAEQPQAIDLPSFVAACREQRIPALVIDPASHCWTGWLDAGADLVLLDAAALGGPDAGIILGRQSAIDACHALRSGVGAILRAAPPTLEAMARIELPTTPTNVSPPLGTAWQPRGS